MRGKIIDEEFTEISAPLPLNPLLVVILRKTIQGKNKRARSSIRTTHEITIIMGDITGYLNILLFRKGKGLSHIFTIVHSEKYLSLFLPTDLNTHTYFVSLSSPVCAMNVPSCDHLASVAYMKQFSLCFHASKNSHRPNFVQS